MSNEGRDQPVTIIGPAGLKKVVNALCIIAPNLPFDLKLLEYPADISEFEFGDIKITPFSAKHSVVCTGYNFKLKRVGKFDVEKAKKNNVPMKIWGQLQKHETVIFEDTEYKQSMVLGSARKGLKVTYCTDSRPTENILNHARNADLLMFGADDKLARAVETGHCLFSEAAQLAKKADVKKLWLTHYSPSLTEPDLYLDTVTDIFPNAELGFDGKSETLNFPE